MATEMLLEIT